MGKISHDIDLGLALLSVVRRPGARLSAHDIAAWCGCSREYIGMVERRALKKLRLKMRELALTGELSETAPKKMVPPELPRVAPDSVQIPFKQWVWQQAERAGVKPGAIYMRLYRHPELKPPMRYVNGRVMMVQLAA